MRLGRSQPHAPIFLRPPIVGFVVALGLAPQIHVVQAEPHRPPRTQVLALRTPFAPPPTDQSHVVSPAAWRFSHPARAADVLVLRPPLTAAVPEHLAPQLHVVSLVAERGPLAGRRARPTIQRTALTPPALSTQPAPPIHVVLPNRRARANPPTTVLVHRTALVPPELASGAAVPVHVIGPIWRVVHPARAADVLVVRSSVTSLVPDRLAPQLHVVLQHRRRPDPPARIVWARNPAVDVPARLPPQVHVLLQHRRRPDPPAHVILERNPLVPPATPLVRALVQDGGGSVRGTSVGTGILPTVDPGLPPAVTPTAHLQGTSIMDTYTCDDATTTLDDDHGTCDDAPNVSVT